MFFEGVIQPDIKIAKNMIKYFLSLWLSLYTVFI